MVTNTISHQGFNVKVITLQTEDTIVPGTPVKIDSDGKATAAENEGFIGIALSQRDNQLAVQVTGYVECPAEMTEAVYNWTGLAGNGSAGVKVSDSADIGLYRVLKYDAVNQKIGFLL